ncbi:MAG: hypothetical protein ABR591_14215 [Candidatus Velthaea sp.]
MLLSTVAIPGVVLGAPFSYDIGIVDSTLGRYYLADRTNKALDIVNTTTLALTQVQGSGATAFTGPNANNDLAGPDGVIVATGGNVFVGDVNNVKVVNPTTNTIATTIPITTSGFRSDEGCYDPDDKIVMIANPADAPPFATFINATTNAVIAKFSFTGSSGLEQCAYDPGTKSFFINNDGTTANPNGELDVFTAASVVAASPKLSSVIPLGNCAPTGLALGLSEQLLVGCSPPTGSPQITQVVSATSGTIVKTITGIGGEDEVAFDPYLKRFYTASRNMTSTGVAGGTVTPVLGVIDAQTLTLLGTVPTSPGSHSVAVDPTNGHVYVPVVATATTPGGINVYKLSGGP